MPRLRYADDGSVLLHRRVNGVYYAYDPRLRTVSNTLDEPATAGDDRSCPAVPRTFLNEGSCVRAPGCGVARYAAVSIVLDDAFLARAFAASGSLVYAIEDLPLADDADPCAGTSRWVTAGCESAVQNANVASALADKAGAVRDVVLGANCGVTAGAKVEGVAGECWRHAHANERDVRDFSAWAELHPGGSQKISGVAVGGDTRLTWPATHPLSRWTTKKKHLAKLGVLGSSAKFSELPASVRSIALAETYDAVASYPDEGFESCGSPGEVAADPTKGHYYPTKILAYDDDDSGDGRNSLDAPTRVTNQVGKNNGRSKVWYTVALKAEDQLRQRVAWALATVFIVSDQGLKNEFYTEPWVAFYDIFVRHAFGNLRDVLREISYRRPCGDLARWYTSEGRHQRYKHDRRRASSRRVRSHAMRP